MVDNSSATREGPGGGYERAAAAVQSRNGGWPPWLDPRKKECIEEAFATGVQWRCHYCYTDGLVKPSGVHVSRRKTLVCDICRMLHCEYCSSMRYFCHDTGSCRLKAEQQGMKRRGRPEEAS